MYYISESALFAKCCGFHEALSTNMHTYISDTRTETFKYDLTIIIIMCMNLEQKIYVQICALQLNRKYAYVFT